MVIVKGSFNADVFKDSHVLLPKDELKEAARTLIGKPVTLDFGNMVIGRIIDAEFVNGEVEYVADIDEPRHLRVEAKARSTTIEEEGVKTLHGVTFTGMSSVTKKRKVGR